MTEEEIKDMLIQLRQWVKYPYQPGKPSESERLSVPRSHLRELLRRAGAL